MTALAIVTGGARGIGLAIARALGRCNHVLIVDRDGDACARAAADLTHCGAVGASPVALDITDPAAADGLVAALATVPGELRSLVNNAGITRDARLLDMSADDFESVVAVNLTASATLCLALADRLVDGGAIVNVSSRAALGNVGQLNYAASKGGLIGLTRALALRLAPRAIRVNAVAPGLTGTDMAATIPDHVLDKLVRRIPLGRMGRPEEIASVVEFLASDAASYVTGQVVLAGGGRSLAA